MLDGYEIQDPWLKGEFQKATAKGIAEGKAEGIAEGKAEGIAEGIAEGENRALRQLLREQLAALGVEPAEAVIEGADRAQLHDWLLPLFRGEVAEVLRAP